MNEIEIEISNGNSNENIEINYHKVKQELELLLIEETRGAQVRAGLKYAELGERCNKFFLGLEKNRAINNTIYKLKNDGTVLDQNSEILDNITAYYKNLYKQLPENDKSLMKQCENMFLNKNNVKTLDETDKNLQDEDITIQELLNSLKSMKNGSSPGLDGLPIEFYKVFWGDIKDIFFECVKFIFKTGSLAPSQSDSLICLLFKGGDLDREEIGNWRPISLVNSDYKIITKCLARRLNCVIDKLIDSNQSAFIKGRNIACMLREVYDVIENEKNSSRSGILLSIDYSKAFDTLATSIIIKALRLYGFGDTFVKWIEIILKNRRCSVRNAGFISKPFAMERGVRQGCPVSPLLFILATELFASYIRSDPKIKGIRIKGSTRTIKIRLFADDTTLFLRDFVDFREVLSRIKMFASFSGLQLNIKKTYALSFGNAALQGRYICGVEFVARLKILGIIFSLREEAGQIEENYTGKIKDLEKLLALWSRRNLTLIGKIIIIKTFGISKFIHIMSSIGVEEKQISKINSILFKFIWGKGNNKNNRVTEKVKRTTLCNAKWEGGLGMINLLYFQDAFLLRWAELLINKEPEEWKLIAMQSFERVGGRAAFYSNVNPSEFKGMELIDNMFWRRVLYTWLKNKNLRDCTYSSELTNNTPLFNNENLKFKNSTLFFKECITKNILYVKDVVRNNVFLSFKDFQALVGGPNAQLIYNCLYNAILKSFPNLFGNPNISQLNYFKDFEFEQVGRKILYKMLNKAEESYVESFWAKELRCSFEKDYWMVAFRCTKETRLQFLHWKVISKIYPTATLLHKMKIRESELCEHCNITDTLVHFFYKCKKVTHLWEK